MPARRSMRADARRSRERLLAAAGEVFAEQGTGAALDDIAKRAGIGNATLYRHFPGRQDLVQALLTDRYDELRDSAKRSLDAPDPLHELTDWLQEFIAHLTAYRGLAASVLEATRDPDTEVSAACQGMRAAAGNLLHRAQDASLVRTDLTTIELLHLTNAIAVAAENRLKQTPRLLSLLLEGLQTTRSHEAAGPTLAGTEKKSAR